MDLGLEGRIAFVTGGSSGIGRETAALLAQEGASVAVTYRTNRDAAEVLVASIRDRGGRACALPLDLGSDESILRAVGTVLDDWGRIDVLVNNAVAFPSPASPRRFEGVPRAEWQALVAANVHGPMLAVQTVLPSMRRSGWGRIVNVSSVAAEDGMRGFGWYAAAKASLQGLTRTLAAELGQDGILSNAVMLGPTLTERVRKNMPEDALEGSASRSSLGRLAAPPEVARVIVFLCSAANAVLTGEVIRTGGRDRGARMRLDWREEQDAS